MNDDLTIIMTTANKLSESWADYHRQKLIEVADGAKIITISYKRLDWGWMNLTQTDYSLTNLYLQIYRGAIRAKTPYIATCDDDTLYPKEHFQFRPIENRPFAYNMNRWHLFSWGKPFYFHKPRPGGGLLVADRKQVIRAIETRMKFREASGDLPGRLCHELGYRSSLDCDEFKWHGFYTEIGVISVYHEQSIDKANRTRRKKAWPVRAYDIPYWGKVDKYQKIFCGE